MSTLQHDELLTQSEILEKKILPPAKETDQHAEAEPDEAHHGQDLYQNGGEMAAAMLLISRSAGVLANHRGLVSSFRLKRLYLDRMDRKSKLSRFQKWPHVFDSRGINGAPGEIRTPDPLLRSRSSYFAKSCQRGG
jgi:hypothetical protein